MKLNDYLDETKTPEAVFGALIGVSQPQVNRLRHGKVKPSFETLSRIVSATNGRVSVEDFADAGAAA